MFNYYVKQNFQDPLTFFQKRFPMGTILYYKVAESKVHLFADNGVSNEAKRVNELITEQCPNHIGRDSINTTHSLGIDKHLKKTQAIYAFIRDKQNFLCQSLIIVFIRLE